MRLLRVQDVDKVPGLGPKSKVKVKEILAKGTSSRIAAAAADEQRKVKGQAQHAAHTC